MPSPRPKRYGRPYRRARLLVLARDGYVCWLCGGPIDKTLPANHPMSATVDHLIPLSHGGDPTDLNNMRAAHHGHNASRGNGTRQRKQQRNNTRRW